MTAKISGKVFLVGAGPGDPGLITQRGASLLQTADVVVVDDLVHPFLLRGLQAHIVYVGKRGPGAPTGSFKKLSQDGINNLLVGLAKTGQRVVRLKGGDPLVFGRGGEEMEALRRHRISFEVVPGVTSAIAAPAFAGIPLSDRRWASQITFLTGRESKSDGMNPGVDWSALSKEGTLVILMGVGEWPKIRHRLLSSGWPRGKSVAAVQSASYASQRAILSTLGLSTNDFKKAKLASPAIIVVGDVAKMTKRLSWLKEQKPLLGRTVVVTRAIHQNQALIQLLEDRGAIVIPLPTIEIEPLTGDVNIKGTIRRLLDKSTPYRWVVFLSENAVRTFAALMPHRQSWPRQVRVCAVGPHTAHVIGQLGWPVSKMAATFHSQGVMKALGNVRRMKILIPRVQGGPKDLVEDLKRRGALVEEIYTYKNVPASPPSEDLRRFILTGVDAISFTSASTVDHFCAFFSRSEIKKIFSSAHALSIGPMTSDALRRQGIRKIIQARAATTPDMVTALVRVPS